MTSNIGSNMQESISSFSNESTLFKLIEQIEDPRKKRGVRHNFHAILKLVIFGFTSRLICLEHIVEYAKIVWHEIKEPLGCVFHSIRSLIPI